MARIASTAVDVSTPIRTEASEVVELGMILVKETEASEVVGLGMILVKERTGESILEGKGASHKQRDVLLH